MSLPHTHVEPADAFILAGGRSSRMGQDKALVTLNGMPLIQHAIAIFRRSGSSLPSPARAATCQPSLPSSPTTQRIPGSAHSPASARRSMPAPLATRSFCPWISRSCRQR